MRGMTNMELSEQVKRNWDERTCANVLCGKDVQGREFVLQVSTKHVRWFCSVPCVVEGQKAHYDEILSR